MTPNEIKRIRSEDLRLSRERFAQVLGVSTLTVGRWERGQTRPSPYQVGLLRFFRKAAQRNSAISADLEVALVTAGVIAALYLLLKLAHE